ncbi:MAG: substrate-binding domain-containing protein [Anaerolineales bacterium]|nr:substrate-binding domain-containing protein [Anaerolineales bacterium]
MAEIDFIHSFNQLKTLADSRRLSILRRLMAAPATLTQLGEALGEHPAWVRHHLKRLEEAGLVEISHTQVTGNYTEKFYTARASALVFQELILPEFPGQQAVVLLGSHDLALNLIARRMNAANSPLRLMILPVGSLDGLVALRQGMAHLTGCHLLDADSGEYNRPYVRHFFPDRQVALVTLAHRAQGLIVAAGNPLGIHTLEDLARPEVRLVNRNRGSGTRLWLDWQLERLGIPTGAVAGYEQEVPTHTAVAMAVAGGAAQAGLGLEAVARLYDLDFIPLFRERYDLVIPVERSSGPDLGALLDLVHGASFRQEVSALGGYETLHTGEQLPL